MKLGLVSFPQVGFELAPSAVGGVEVVHQDYGLLDLFFGRPFILAVNGLYGLEVITP